MDEEIESRKRRREHEVEWEKTRESRIGSWRDFQGKGKVAGGGGGGGEGKRVEGGGQGGGQEAGGKKKKQKLKVLG